MTEPKGRHLASFLLLVLVVGAHSASYECPSSCVQTENCYCSSSSVPAGLKAANVPQFIVLTTDDPITPSTMKQILSITTENYNRNGCGMPATWFVNANSTNASLAQQAFVQGHEIGIQSMYGEGEPTAADIINAKKYLNQTMMLPIDKIRGFRAPFLVSDPSQRVALAANGFRFDSSVVTPSSDAASYIWPYTLDYGIPQNCTTGVCSVDESYPGLWELPAWMIQDSNGNQAGPIDPSTTDLYTIYANALAERMNGNRAPLGIYLHAATLMANPTMVTQINEFLTWALNLQNTWVVTVSQVLDWMNNPESIETYNAECPSVADQLAQLPSDIDVCILPNTGCNYGTWNPNTCSCDCQSEDTTTQGYCKDETGSCTVVKPFNFTANEYMCSPVYVTSPPPPATNEPASAPAAAVGPNLQLSQANCGHPLVDFAGLSITGYSDSGVGYSNALKAVDGSCTTCGLAPIQDGVSYFTVELPYPVTLSGVSIISSWDVLGTVTVGNSLKNGGLDGQVCAEEYKLIAGKAVNVPCNSTGSVITISTEGTLTICDIFPIVAANLASPPPAAGALTSVPVSMNVLGVSADQAETVTGPTICSGLLAILDETDATCVVLQVTAVSSRRRRLLSDAVQINFNVTTSQPELLRDALDQPYSVAANLIDVLSVPVTADSISYGDAFYSPPPPASSPPPPAAFPPPSANPSSHGSTSSNAGAIAGGVVGGVVGGAVLIFAIIMIVRWRRRRANASPASNNDEGDAKPDASQPSKTTTTTKPAKGRGPAVNQKRRGPAINNKRTKNHDATATLGVVTESKTEDKV